MATGTPNPLRQGPENYSDLGDMMASVMGVMAKQLENMMPCKVVSYDRVANTAIVQPMLKVIMTGGVYPRAEIGPVPVFAAGAGGFVVNFPIKAGDLGWLLANDRDITAFVESLAESEPATYRTHSFNDSVLFPDAMRGFTTSGEDGNMVIQSTDGATRISLGAGRILLKHPTLVRIECPMVETTGDVKVAGTLTATTDVIGGGVSLKNHKHTLTQPGTGQSGVPAA